MNIALVTNVIFFFTNVKYKYRFHSFLIVQIKFKTQECICIYSDPDTSSTVIIMDSGTYCAKLTVMSKIAD